MSDTDRIASRIEAMGLGAYGLDELRFMVDTVLDAEPAFIGDWGTNLGVSARVFRETAVMARLDTTVVTVDLPPELEALDRDHAGWRTGSVLRGVEGVECLFGDGVTTTLMRWAQLGRPERALFFLDGDHARDAVYRELRMIHRLAPRAVALVHDTADDGPCRGGPLAASLSFSLSHRYEMDRLGSQAGMVRLRPIA